ncbi:alcohol dehydrogenase, propanol-preferring [Sporothrix schenckii 1099-18]|uniref:Alcohol dehydrogenase, propanol-preferring n=1 Tax=Sporothrix schenckii 1099-18 TaxID=1397361 RepID=A0A0F2M695_SPOSC|nr:alcohol dehydrogenase, propanol-preferring [Sporothrix schenckii 1099-18]KJR83706.1 alcohol dehydrogenase, propanol-preferring [Sporothrix schenckii 1099-18]
MKAGQWNGATKSIELNNVPVPEPAEGQFLIRMHSASLCHSDLMPEGRPDAPTTMGHEGVGFVEAIHPSAEGKGFVVGDAVGFLPFLDACFACDACHVHNLRCEQGTTKLQGWTSDGFFAEYVAVSWQNCAKIPPQLDMARAAPLFCAGVTAFHAVTGCALAPGEWLAVVGCGGLGQYATQFAKAMGYKVVGVDIQDDVLAAVTALGADAVINTRTTTAANVDEAIHALTAKGVHAAAVFSAATAAYETAITLLRPGGLLMVVGITDTPLPVTAMDLCTGRYRLKAKNTGTARRMPPVLAFAAHHRIQPAVDFRTLEDLPSMVEAMHQGQATRRQVVLF